MEAITINQTEIYDALVKFLTNFKKDGADRKTMDYCKRKLELLENYWRDYQRNHRKCCELSEFGHVYFTESCYDKAEEVYLSAKQLITKTMELLLSKQQGVRQLPQLPQEAGVSNRTENASRSQANQQQDNAKSAERVDKLGDMIKKQTINFRAFKRTVATIEVEKLQNKWEFEDALKCLQSRWVVIDNLHWEIEGENGDENMWYQNEFSEHEKIYNDLKKTINSKMWSETHRDKSTPKMDIPVFQGNYHHWTSFKDLFTETIHKNPSLSNAQKMQFLKSKVAGEAERLIHHLQISSENYEVCWEILNHRYGNQRLIFTSHVNILLNLPNMQNQTMGMLKKLHDVTKECLHAIQNLGVDITTWDPLLVHLLAQKLDSESFSEYMESVKSPRTLPILQEFLDFLENKFTALEASRRKQESNNQKTIQPAHQNQSYQKKSFQFNNHQQSSNNNQFYKMKNNVKTMHVSKSITCALCNADHGLWLCAQFLQMSDEQKLKTVNQLNYCVNCLFNHFNKQCFSTKRCRKCYASHNTLLHEGIMMKNQSNTSAKSYHKATTTPTNFRAAKNEHAATHVSQNDITETLLSTAIVKITGADGTQHTMRALIDQGSQISIISEHAAQILKLKRNKCKGTIFGIGEKENNCKGVMKLRIQSIYSDFAIEGETLIMKSLIKNLPNKTFVKPSWPHIQTINLADPEFYTSRAVDLLLGADVYCKIMLGGILRGDSEDQPIAQQTQLGWLLCGTMKTRYNCNVVLHNTDDLRRFWENEDINQQNEMSTEDHECLQFFLSTTERLEDGRFQVRLPFKKDSKEQLGASKPLALAQFRNLEKKLQRNPEVKREYEKFMNEYITLNHMALSNTNATPECYLPHHSVIRAESTTTKLRVVFNASARSLSGVSLNDIMYRGPNLQQDLQELILKWRQYEYVYTADIEKMYRQILVHPEDQPYQKILWRDNQNQPIRTYQLTTVTYGTKPAPFLAMMCLKQLATAEQKNYPDAAKALEESFYMDDYCGGQHSIEQANQLKQDLIKILRKGGFNLRKWASNEPKLLSDLDKSLCNQQTYEFKQSDSTKTLGLAWNPQKDKFIFDSKLEQEVTTKPTKRSLLSDISKLFDPLGWLTPLSITMKIMFQTVWLSNLSWDDILPNDIETKWTKLRRDLKEINTIEVNRWLGIRKDDKVQLHGFCDASNQAYAAVIYCRVSKGENSTAVLVAAKAKVVPINKTISTPRLELMGAQLLSKLIQKVKSCLEDYNIKTYCWTDSTAVLGWIQGDPGRWKPFVANRVQAITKLIPSEHWKYVNTSENPADCASRGLATKQLKEHELWWHGPSWIKSFQNQDTTQPTYITNLEVKKSSVNQSNAVVVKQQNKPIILYIINHLLTKFSCYAKIIRIFAWLLRLPTANRVRSPYLTLQELRRANIIFIKNVQQMEFADDINSLITKGKVHSKSKLLSLNPFLDQDGILRVNGRLKNAHLSPGMKHPIIIPHNHRITTLIIKQAHELTFHGGARLTLSNIRQKYWIISGYMATKKYIRQCVTCHKQQPIRQYQLMGDLPSSRVNPATPFYHCGVDYTGFVEIKANKGRGIKTTKGYIAIFVCMATKAVHLELVSDLTSSAFLAALHRMAARRGTPRHIYSDNGTNFVGANRLLQEEYECLQQIFSENFYKEITELQVEWHFNAPSCPHAGGLWERAVRSLKHHLKRVIGHQKLTFEEYCTLLAKIEACLNSRPLCALTEDPEDLDFLTPAHFLTTRPGVTVMETAEDARTRWHLVTKLYGDLWKKWKSEYLTQLSARNKWLKYQKNVKVGDLVVIQEDNLPAGRWPVGRITEVHPGNDDLVRVVTLKTKNGYIKRPIVKLSVLPVETETENEPIKPKTNNAEPEARSSRHAGSPAHPRIVNIALALLMFISIITPTTASFNYKQLDSNQTLYFDPLGKMQLIRDKWKLVTYYDMSPYWQGDKAVKDFTNYLEKTCETIKEPSHCHMILLQIRHDYNELQYYNQLLLSQHYNTRMRTRRGLINAVGSIANSLFGVLDESFAEKYKQDIELVHRNQNHLAELWKNQTSIVEAEHNILQRTEAMIEKQHKIINRHLHDLELATSNIQKEIDVMTMQQDFTFVSIATINLMQNLKRIQDTLIDTISEVYHGQISLHILTPAQLKRELQIIYGQMPKDLVLPIDNVESDLQHIYKLLKTKAKVTETYIIFEITLPLIARESFQVYKILSVPQETDNSMVSVIPVSDYVAVNLKKDSYFIPTVHELNTCLLHGESFMCELFKPILSLQNDQNFCEINPITYKCNVEKSVCQNKWVELQSTSQYLYFCCGSYSVKIICDDQVSVQQLTGAGVISLSQSCFIKGKDFSLYSLQQQSNQIELASNILIPELDQINHIVKIKIPSDEESPNDILERQGLNKSLSILGEQIKDLKSSKAEIDDISYHDIHHYTIGYILLTIAISGAAVWTWRRYCSLPTRRGGGEACQRQESSATAPKTISDVYSEVQPRMQTTADRQLSDNEQIGLSSFLAKRWPSTMRKTANTNRSTLPIPRKERVVTIEDSLV